ncbi:Hint domain-containing protein [Sulfitobacter sp. F26169L]|uniref:Hint domain-containing protein n=1 Tax=Sulfitobacter sp. F26169L TaxID=2996015 RepID=UPI002260A712|nr:Hint domain-containing protein [Sulfitobacter sp. F26169L]MCX7566999.1 Hint domain-containing protein [Sulfitobacter sp. F26169L]
MTLTANPAAARSAARKTGYGMTTSSMPNSNSQMLAAQTPKRTYEVAALREDDSLFIGQSTAPAIALFEDAFSAFTHGSLIQTTLGLVAVEDLQPGDMVQTATGEAAELVWVGTSTFTPADAGKRTPLIRIMPDSLGQSRPERSLTVGPGARILHTPAYLRGLADGKQLLTPASKFVDGVNVIEVTPPTPIRLFHICLSRHAVINVDGIEMETFHPGAAAPREVSHALRDRFISLFPRISHLSDFGPLAHPRAPEIDAH